MFKKIKNIKIADKLKKFKLDPAMLALFVFIMLLLSRLAMRTISEAGNEYLSLVIFQLLTFGIPAAIWCRLREIDIFRLDKHRYVSRLRMTRPRVSHIAITAAAVFALISGCLLLSINFSGESSLEGSFSLYDTFVSKYNATPLGALWLILAYAALPAIGEELIFRGILCAEYDRYGVICSVTVSSLWFSLLHFNFAKITVYIFAGLVLSLLLYATRSLYTVMIVHFIYNLFGIFGQQYITEFYITAGSIGVVIIILIMILLLSSVLFCGGASRLYSGYSKRDEPSNYREPVGRAELIKNYRSAIITPCSAACVALFLAVCILGIIIK